MCGRPAGATSGHPAEQAQCSRTREDIWCTQPAASWQFTPSGAHRSCPPTGSPGPPPSSRTTTGPTAFTDVLPGADAETIEAVMRQVLQNGTTKIHEYRTWLPTSQGAEKPFAVSFQCLQGADGESLGVCVISADVTASWQARERLAVLDRASARLGSTLDVMQAGQELADLAVPLLADYVAVDLEQSISFGEGPPVGISATGSRLPAFRRAGLASIRQGVPESPWMRGEPVDVPADSPFTAVLRAGKPRLEPVLDTGAGTWIDSVPGLARRVRENGMHSIMIVPIRARRALPRDRSAVRHARRLAAHQLTQWGLEGLADATRLIVSELVTNAVRHGTGPIELRLVRHRVLTCEVSDTAAFIPRPHRARTTDENGRGLFLVTNLSRRWGARSTSGGKVVWAEQELPPHVRTPTGCRLSRPHRSRETGFAGASGTSPPLSVPPTPPRRRFPPDMGRVVPGPACRGEAGLGGFTCARGQGRYRCQYSVQPGSKSGCSFHCSAIRVSALKGLYAGPPSSSSSSAMPCR
ncbi:ATP-binding protein [Streptomyces sp. NPDC093269]|uniref:ATP-binding protein n=1 Tax=Streptomyces sp. NPDC093269 TaxID=3366038 RepID=UPI0037F493B4